MEENNYKWAVLTVYTILVFMLIWVNAGKDAKIKHLENENAFLNEELNEVTDYFGGEPDQVLRATVVDSFEDIVVVRLPSGDYWAFRNQKPHQTNDIVYLMAWGDRYEILGYVAAPIDDIDFTLATITTMRDVGGGRLYTIVDEHNETAEIYSREIYASGSVVVVIRIKNKLYIGGIYDEK